MALLSDEQLKHLLHGNPLSQKDKGLLILAAFDAPQELDAVRQLGRCCGLRDIGDWNLAHVYAKSAGMAIRTAKGWELHSSGREHIRSIAALAKINLVVTNASHSLRQHLSTIRSAGTRAFVDEAIVCFEARQYRAAVVFAWVGAVSLLYERVVSSHLVDFNREATRRDADWRPARNADDLSRMKEHEFLNVLEAMGVFGKNVKLTLQNHCLQLRNSCGHPNSLQIGENSVAAHIEKLILNVYSKF